MTSTKQKGIRHRIRGRLRRLRRKSPDVSEGVPIKKSLDGCADTSSLEVSKGAVPTANPASVTESSASPPSLGEATDNPRESATTVEIIAQAQAEDKPLSITDPDLDSNAECSTLGGTVNTAVVYSDLWSAAYREAVDSLGGDIDVAILKGKNVAHLFKELEDIDKEATEESAFLRGVEYLRSLQVPLERFKLALDLASPLTSIDPSSRAVFGVVSGVTAIAISFATADMEFAKQIGEMLEQISYIDDCDTLGQKTNKTDIHNALVQVYRQILEFYKAAFEILTKRGAKLVMKMVLETDRLPSILKEFLKHANTLGKLVQKATLEIVEDIKSMLYDREIARWLGSGRMSQQSQYHASLQEVCADEACEFLLQDANFVSWYRASASRQLVILGDMGCGKTVSMAFLVDTLSKRNEHQLPQPKICYYYCRDDETGQAARILSALILALLEQLSGLKKTFFDWYKQAQASGYFEPATNIKKLEEFLHLVVESLDRPLYIVIDGLDECDRASRKALLQLLQSLSQRTPRLKTLLSSRPQEEILEQMAGTARIDLASNTERDRAIAAKTVNTRLAYLPDGVKALVIDRLSAMAQGSAIWTRMVVELIERRGIRALGSMSRFLDEQTLPRSLSDLYEALLTRCTSGDPENHDIATTALKLLAVARRPLTVLELSWAAALGTTREVTTVAGLSQHVDHQRLMSLIQPFVSRVDFSDLNKRQVRLVHQSVKEFVISNCASGRPHPQDQAFSAPANGPPTAADRGVESLESHMLDICVRYLLLDEIDETYLFSENQVALENLPQTSNLFDDDEGPVEYDGNCSWEAWEEDMIHYDPTERGLGELFVYASCHWVHHFGAITRNPLPDLASIETLCRAGSTRLRNWIEQNCRPDCAINPRYEFDSSLYDPLSITSMYGSEAMMRHVLATSEFRRDSYQDGPWMETTIQIVRWGDLSRLRILLLESRVEHQVQVVDFFRIIMTQWTNFRLWRDDWHVAFDVVDDTVDTLVRNKLGNELLCQAAMRGCMPLVQRLMTRARHHVQLRRELLGGVRLEPQPPSRAQSVHQSIGEAVLRDHVDVVEYLLAEDGIETHLCHINSRGENVLHLASRLCNPAVFRLLAHRLPGGGQQKDEMGDTPLLRVIKSSFVPHDRCEAAKILLLHGAANGKGDCVERQTPLEVAVKLGDVDMCDVLIRVGGLDPRSVLTRHSDGRMVLKDDASSEKPDMETTLLLLRKHANMASMMANSMAPAKQHFGINEARQEGDAALVDNAVPERHGQLVCLAQGCSTPMEKTTRPVGYK